VVVDSRCDQRRGIFLRHLFDVDDDAKVAVLRKFQRSAFQELFSFRIEVSVMERRRIHRIAVGCIDFGTLGDRDGHLGRMQHRRRH